MILIFLFMDSLRTCQDICEVQPLISTEKGTKIGSVPANDPQLLRRDGMP